MSKLPKSLQKENLKKYQEARKNFLEYQINVRNAQNLEYIRDDKHGLICTFICNRTNKFILLAWLYSKRKPSYFYNYNTTEDREERIQSIQRRMKECEECEEFEAHKAKMRKKGHEDISIGDAFVSSWGYDQTNVDFYEVVGKKGKTTLLLREISQTRTYDSNGLSGKCQPLYGKFISDEIIEKRLSNGSINFESYRSASKVQKEVIAGVEVTPSYYWSAWA